MTRLTPDPSASTSCPEHEDGLARLPAHDVGPERAERIRHQAHLLLHQHQRRKRPQPSSGWVHSYHRFVEPAVLIGLGLWQLAWTLQDTVALYLP